MVCCAVLTSLEVLLVLGHVQQPGEVVVVGVVVVRMLVPIFIMDFYCEQNNE
jgi:hypothetical protein